MTTNVFFGGLPSDISTHDLRTYLAYHHPIGMDLHREKGIAFVQFETPKDASKVIDTFHQKMFLGRRIIVDEARSTPPVHKRGNNRSRLAPHEKQETSPPESPSSNSDGPPPPVTPQSTTPQTTPPLLMEDDSPSDGQISRPSEINEKRDTSYTPTQHRSPTQSRQSPSQLRDATRSQNLPRQLRFTPYDDHGRSRGYRDRGNHTARDHAVFSANRHSEGDGYRHTNNYTPQSRYTHQHYQGSSWRP
ncbi:uncharacterized protein EI90DRAFT_3156854 [Cantharellus anzutake]|uniref:uncharacterized protein n=1 Tax=Cantharellus anzutake TaxID=1750568 RepID=UPI001906187E|nr:uncharacterized protein EI90DRAFT_3156854 [Cantharellus anzutake]KAF8325849.1 hypothetical protein EI90DRAFT_3156854 [Cantharellus anzutake]